MFKPHVRALFVIAFLCFAAPAQAFDVVGVVGKDKPVQLRVKLASGKWTPWKRADVGEPVWAQNATKAQLRGHTKGVHLEYVRVPHERPVAHVAATLPLPTTNAKAAEDHPALGWDPQGRCKPRTTPGLGNIRMAFVHHTVSLNGYTRAQSAGIVLGICLFHRNGNGWNDIGYNFLVDRYGQVFEGRQGGIDQPVVGAQAGGFNVPSTGVSMIGDFSSTLPPKAAMTSLARLLAWKLSLTGVPATGRIKVTSAGGPSTGYRAGTQVTLNRISGHRDADQTACPGAALYHALPALRRRVAKLEGATSKLSLTTTPSLAYGGRRGALRRPHAGGRRRDCRDPRARGRRRADRRERAYRAGRLVVGERATRPDERGARGLPGRRDARGDLERRGRRGAAGDLARRRAARPTARCR